MGVEGIGTTDSTFDNLGSENHISINLTDKFTSDTLVKINILDEVDNKEEPIYEMLRPDEILVLYKDSDGIVYVGNENGKLFIEKLPWIGERNDNR